MHRSRQEAPPPPLVKPSLNATRGYVVVLGMATTDTSLVVDKVFTGANIVDASSAATQAYGVPGGAVYHISVALVKAGHTAYPVTYLGDDLRGDSLLRAFEAIPCASAGIGRARFSDSPACLLIHQPDGSTGCVIDRSIRSGPLTAPQMRLIRDAGTVVLTAGFPDGQIELFDVVSCDCFVVWVAKSDPRCFPDDLARLCAGRANLIVCNSAERGWVESMIQAAGNNGVTLIVTQGSNGADVISSDRKFRVPATPVEAANPTGAGDTFAGALLSELLSGSDSFEAAVTRANEQTAQFLESH